MRFIFLLDPSSSLRKGMAIEVEIDRVMPVLDDSELLQSSASSQILLRWNCKPYFPFLNFKQSLALPLIFWCVFDKVGAILISNSVWLLGSVGRISRFLIFGKAAAWILL